jgi:hypothetical protein
MTKSANSNQSTLIDTLSKDYTAAIERSSKEKEAIMDAEYNFKFIWDNTHKSVISPV